MPREKLHQKIRKALNQALENGYDLSLESIEYIANDLITLNKDFEKRLPAALYKGIRRWKSDRMEAKARQTALVSTPIRK